MEDILTFVEENLALIIGVVGTSGFMTFLYHKFKTKVVPKIIVSVVNLFGKLLNNMFGIQTDEEPLADALPFVTEFNNLKADIVVTVEMKLMDLKQKITSPVYTDKEKEPMVNMFNYLYDNYKNKISNEVKTILDEFEKTNL